jgi:alpha-glucoside transport system ATP-binding protein
MSIASKAAPIRFEGVSKTFGKDVVAVDNIDLAVDAGKLVTLLGPSGCGKTTTLRMIAGLEMATSGRITIGEVDVTKLPATDRDVSMVFQSYALFPHMSVLENVMYGLTFSGFGKGEARSRASQGLELVGLKGFDGRLPAELSGGQQQRVAVARALVLEPQVLLFDEPLSNLDAALRVATRIEIAQLKESMPESTMIYVTHDQVEAMTLASRIVVLAGGGIAQVGTPLQLYERPENEFVAQFIGSPAMNLLPGKISETGAQTRIELADGGEAVSDVPSLPEDTGKDVNIGVRPEDFVATDGPHVFQGKVSISEALGEVTILYFEPEGGADPVIAKLAGIHRDQRGNNVSLTAHPSKVHVFHDTQSLLYRDHPIKRIPVKAH